MIRLVLADDQHLVRGALAALLALEPDLEVVGEAADGVEALRLAGRSRPDVALVDIRMPGLDGLEVTRRLAGLGRWPVIATQAGHDAGILSDAGIPTAMLFVRNPTGISHSPDEHAETADCLTGVEALADVLAELAGAPA